MVTIVEVMTVHMIFVMILNTLHAENVLPIVKDVMSSKPVMNVKVVINYFYINNLKGSKDEGGCVKLH